MSEVETKSKVKFRKLRETMETAAKQEKIKSEKASIYDKIMEVYKNNEFDASKKSEMFISILSSISSGEL